MHVDDQTGVPKELLLQNQNKFLNSNATKEALLSPVKTPKPSCRTPSSTYFCFTVCRQRVSNIMTTKACLLKLGYLDSSGHYRVRNEYDASNLCSYFVFKFGSGF
jgi:hypothetical protein